MLAKGSCAVMILAMNVVGNGATYRHKAGAGRDREEPAHGYDQCQNICQEDTRFTAQDASRTIKGKRPVETTHIQ